MKPQDSFQDRRRFSLSHPMGYLFIGVRASSLLLTRIFNPKGIASSSPGLRGTSYPGESGRTEFQPQRGCGSVIALSRAHVAATPLGLFSPPRCPRVARKLATLGFEPESLWDSAF